MELIDKKPLLRSLVDCQMSNFVEVGHEREYNLLDSIIKGVENAPTVEAKEVVRCKDCKHSDLPAVLTRKYGKIGTLTCHNRYSPCNNRNVNEKDFCSYGEMRTSAE